MENTIMQKVVEAIQSLYNENIDSKLAQPQKTKKEFVGDLTVVVFPFLKASKKSPEQTAHDLGEYLKQHIDQIEDFNVVKGFLNLSISANYWVELLEKLMPIKPLVLLQLLVKRTWWSILHQIPINRCI